MALPEAPSGQGVKRSMTNNIPGRPTTSVGSMQANPVFEKHPL